MTAPTDPAWPQDDATLEAALGGVLRTVDAVPPSLVADAKQLLVWRTIEDDLARLADLTFDSANEELAGVRGFTVASSPRHLRLAGPGDAELELMVTPNDDGTRTVDGQLVPPLPLAVAMRVGDRILTAQADELGTFVIPDLPAERVRLLVQVDAEPYLTPWLDL